MNYLSHHFFDSLLDPHHNTGLILPDWSRSASGRRKLIWTGKDDDPLHYHAIWEGCLKHYQADDWFHDSPFFLELSAELDRTFEIFQEDGLFQSQRKWFLAHLLAEMLLDRLIIEKHPGALDHFYHDLKSVAFSDLETFLLQAGKEEIGHFPQVHKGFIESEFMRYYASDRGLVESLNRVAQRTKQVPFTEAEMEALIGQIGNLLDRTEQIKKPSQMERL
ncbi:MAG: hypothetical protein LPK45_02135 [Bacteroidota bacterium]|nr:hypothetical protein [Bacteroidota bacterium]MDX5429833.1 hypothetical protein [Bacteroidota bacterium]MDX5468612.1 hypothetical protein [Bacteroidota bacterium]